MPETAHRCDAMTAAAAERARMISGASDGDFGPPQLLWGPAVTRIERSAERWWMHNEEYSSAVRFCPWCGTDLDRLHDSADRDPDVEAFRSLQPMSQRALAMGLNDLVRREP